MLPNIKMSKNPLDSIFNDLKLFEQYKYSYNYIKKNNPDISDDEIIEHAEISSACFRQEREYYNAATNVSLCTSPLLYSYALNNLLKGSCYLKTFDEQILLGFRKHGFGVKTENITSNILETKINIYEDGAVYSLLKIYGQSLLKQEINFNKILRHIPGIEDVYFKSLNSISLVALQNKNDSSEFYFIGDKKDDKISKIFDEIGLVGNTVPREEKIICYININGQQKIKNNTYKKENIYFKDYLILPEYFDEGIKDINLIFYCYLLIMSYGMLVRYNAHYWEKFIDKKFSNEAILIELSVIKAVENFYFQIHYMLFGYYYDNNAYSDFDVKKVIDDSTVRIMNNITKEIKSRNLQYNSHDELPWRENYR
jgi:hypothetical protein